MQGYSGPMSGTGSQSEWVQHAPHNAMDDPGEIARFYDCCSVLMRELLNALAAAPERPRCFPEIEDSIGWPRRRIASVLGGVWHLRTTEFSGRRPYRFIDEIGNGTADSQLAQAPGRWASLRHGRSGSWDLKRITPQDGKSLSLPCFWRSGRVRHAVEAAAKRGNGASRAFAPAWTGGSQSLGSPRDWRPSPQPCP